MGIIVCICVVCARAFKAELCVCANICMHHLVHECANVQNVVMCAPEASFCESSLTQPSMLCRSYYMLALNTGQCPKAMCVRTAGPVTGCKSSCFCSRSCASNSSKFRALESGSLTGVAPSSGNVPSFLSAVAARAAAASNLESLKMLRVEMLLSMAIHNCYHL